MSGCVDVLLLVVVMFCIGSVLQSDGFIFLLFIYSSDGVFKLI